MGGTALCEICCVFTVTSPSVLNSLICHWMLLQVGSQTPFFSSIVVKLSHSLTVLEASQSISQQLGTTLHREYRQKELVVAL